MKYLSHRRLWVLISDYLTLHEVALNLSLSCKRLLSVLDHEEVWRPKLFQFLWYKSTEILIASAKTSLQLCYMKSKRVVDYVDGLVSSYSYDFHSFRLIVHCDDLPFFDLDSVCVLRNGNIFGASPQYMVLDTHAMDLVQIAQPSFSMESRIAVAGAYHVYLVAAGWIQVYSLTKNNWKYIPLPAIGMQYNAMRDGTRLFVIYKTGILEIEIDTWRTNFISHSDERVHDSSYICSFLCNSIPVVVTKYRMLIDPWKTVEVPKEIVLAIPLRSRKVKEDGAFVYFGREGNLFRYVKAEKRIERYCCKLGGVDKSLAVTFRRKVI